MLYSKEYQVADGKALVFNQLEASKERISYCRLKYQAKLKQSLPWVMLV